MEVQRSSGLKIVGFAYVLAEKEKEVNADRHRRRSNEGCRCSPTRAMLSAYHGKQTHTHCEIVFPSDADELACRAYGVFGDKGVVRQQRTFSNPSYAWVYLAVTRRQYDSALAFCEAQVGKPYDFVAASWRLVVWPPISTGERWWCASFVHAALQRAGLLRHHSVNTLDVDDLVGLVSASDRKLFDASPLALRTLTEKKSKSARGPK